MKTHKTLVGTLTIMLVALLFARTAFSDCPTHGLTGNDFLALEHQNFPWRLALQLTKPCSALGTLDFTFGNHPERIKAFLSSGKIAAYRVHFFNGPGIRNGNLGSYDPAYRLSPKTFDSRIRKKDKKLLRYFDRRVRQYCALIPKYPAVDFYFSWSLEHNLSKAGYRILDSEGRRICSERFVSVDSPAAYRVQDDKTIKLELHSTSYLGQINSLDGTDIKTINKAAWLKATRNKLFRLQWAESFNCRKSGWFIDPRARRKCPQSSELISLMR